MTTSSEKDTHVLYASSLLTLIRGISVLLEYAQVIVH